MAQREEEQVGEGMEGGGGGTGEGEDMRWQ